MADGVPCLEDESRARIVMRNKLFQVIDFVTLRYVATKRLCNTFARGASITFEEMSRLSDTDLDTTTRFVRHATTFFVFDVSASGQVQHTALSALLAESEDDRALVELFVKPMMSYIAGSEDQSSLDGSEQILFFDTLDQDSELFAMSMKAFSSSKEFELRKTLDGYQWASLGNARVVDIGGSSGFVAMALAREFPNLRIEVQDLDRGPQQRLGLELDMDIADRVTFKSHDFFEPQPEANVDVFFFRFVLHNWPDEKVVTILRNLSPATRPGTVVVVHELIMEDDTTAPRADFERADRTMDIMMLALHKARERTLKQWQDLFARADDRFRLRRWARSQDSNMGSLEFVWQGKNAGNEAF